MDMSDIRAALRDVLGKLPNVAANNGIRAELNDYLSAPNVVGKPYVRTISWTGLAAAGVTPASMTQDATGPFIIQAGSYFADIALAIQTDSSRVIPLVNVLLTDTGTGEAFSDVAVPIPCLFGTGEQPFVWPQQKVIAANSQITATPLNRTAGTTYNIILCFHGVRLVKQ